MTETVTKDDFEQLLDEAYTYKLNVVDVVKGVVVKKEKDGYLVDIGSKTEAFLPNREILVGSNQTLDDVVKLYEEKEFYVMKDEEDDEVPVLSLKKISFAQSWGKLNDMRLNNETCTAKVAQSVKGGLVVEIEGIRGFIPSSQLRAGSPNDCQADQEIEVKILEADPKRNKLILSQRMVLAQQREMVADGIISKLQIDDVLEGEVVRITDFGAFVDINGIDGLLPISEISWDRIKHPSSAISLGQKIQVKVIKIDEDLKRVSLSLKRMTPNPWDEITKNLQEGDYVDGTIIKITSFGMFINIFPGVEALLPALEIPMKRSEIKNTYSVGDTVKTKIKKFTPNEHRICLTMKDFDENEMTDNE